MFSFENTLVDTLDPYVHFLERWERERKKKVREGWREGRREGGSEGKRTN